LTAAKSATGSTQSFATTHDQKEVNMKTQNRFLTNIVLVAACLVLALPAMASTIVYSNGPYSPSGVDAWAINYGFSVSDSFYLGAPTKVTGFVFYAWESPGDLMTDVTWQITLKGGAGSPHFGVADKKNKYGQGLLVDTPDLFGYGPDTITVTLPLFDLTPGTYVLTLSNAAVPSGDPVFWDQNSGVGCTGSDLTKKGCPSAARENVVGTIPSESFSIWGE
jgi:hypothetical protein